VTLPARRNLALGGAALFLLLWVFSGSDDDASGPAGAAAIARAPAGAAGQLPVEDVKLELLGRRRPDLADAERNLFRFEARAAPSPPPESSGPRLPRAVTPAPIEPPVAAMPPVPAGPPPPPPIPIRFIGLLEAPSQAGRIAILSDGRGNIFYGKEGDIIEGRYKVLRVGPDVAELSYLDGRGRQTVRLSGQ
jgi:hypothetical protein